MSTNVPFDQRASVQVRGVHFPWLVLAVLDVAFDSDLDFDFPRVSTLVPADGRVDLTGPDRQEAARLVAEALEAKYGIRVLSTAEVL